MSESDAKVGEKRARTDEAPTSDNFVGRSVVVALMEDGMHIASEVPVDPLVSWRARRSAHSFIHCAQARFDSDTKERLREMQQRLKVEWAAKLEADRAVATSIAKGVSDLRAAIVASELAAKASELNRARVMATVGEARSITIIAESFVEALFPSPDGFQGAIDRAARRTRLADPISLESIRYGLASTASPEARVGAAQMLDEITYLFATRADDDAILLQADKSATDRQQALAFLVTSRPDGNTLLVDENVFKLIDETREACARIMGQLAWLKAALV